jgi:hypothetical protein
MRDWRANSNLCLSCDVVRRDYLWPKQFTILGANMKLLDTRRTMLFQCLGGLLLIIASCAAAQTRPGRAVEVRNLEVLREGNNTKVEVTLSASVNPSVEIATQPDRLVLVLPNTVSSAQQRRLGVNDNGVRRVRMGLNSASPPVTRVVVDLDEARPYALTPVGNKITLTVRPALTGTSRSDADFGSDRSVVSTQLNQAIRAQQHGSPSVASSVPAASSPTVAIPSSENGAPQRASSASTGNAQAATVSISGAASPESHPAEAPKQSASLATSPPVANQPVHEATPSSAPAAATVSEGHYEPSPIPVVTGFMAFQSSFAPGEKHINPVFDPILLVPLGSKLLVESEFEMNLDVVRSQGQWGPAAVDHSIEYLQLNYMAHPNLTITAGRFLTPFGIYRERIHPLWVRNLQDEPIIFAMNANSSNGAMLRGAARLNSGVNLTYATYYSAPTNWKLMPSDRRAGGRASLFFPNQRLEIGASFSRTLGDLRYNMVGVDATWNLKRIPLDIRAEGLRNAVLGSGYWVEGAYRLNKLGRNPFLRKSQVVLRGEQYFTPSIVPMSNAAADMMSQLPDRDTKRIGLGWNYYLTNGIRLNAGFGRNFALGENMNTWGAGITYRFAAY